MHRPILLLCILFPVIVTATHTPVSETKRLESLCRIWGFLKYYHPHVARGQRNWDQELIEKIPQVLAAQDKETLNEIYAAWLEALGKVRRCNNCSVHQLVQAPPAPDFSWLQDTSVFSPAVSARLAYIRDNPNRGRHYYYERRYRFFRVQTSYRHEKTYSHTRYPSKEYRLLALFRYWNVIRYFYPCTYHLQPNWNEVLNNMVPLFADAPDATAYQLALQRLDACLQDSHSGYTSTEMFYHFGPYYPPFYYDIADGKAVIRKSLQDSLMQAADLAPGDVITAIRGRPLQEYIDSCRPYMSGSNEPARLRGTWHLLMSGKEDTVSVTVDRNGQTRNTLMHRWHVRNARLSPEPDTAAAWRQLDEQIGYFNISKLTRRNIREGMRTFRHTKGLIIDMRKYPTTAAIALSRYLMPKRTGFARIASPNLHYPGTFRYGRLWKVGPLFHNRHYYRGQVVLLINEYTQSMGEYTTMALQRIPGVVLAGSQTAGALGNVASIKLPNGEGQPYFTGLGVYYPDGKEAQRVGIRPDIPVRPGISALRERRDEVLERAAAYIRTGK